MKWASFWRNFDFFAFLGFWGAFRLVFFSGTPEWVKFAVVSILPDPGRPGDPMVGPHTDCVASWDTVGDIQALGGPQGPPQTGFGVPWRFWQFCKAGRCLVPYGGGLGTQPFFGDLG